MMPRHYTIEELELYRNGKMSMLGKIACNAHLKNCPECQKRMEQLKEDDKFLEELRKSIAIYSSPTIDVTTATATVR